MNDYTYQIDPTKVVLSEFIEQFCRQFLQELAQRHEFDINNKAECVAALRDEDMRLNREFHVAYKNHQIQCTKEDEALEKYQATRKSSPGIMSDARKAYDYASDICVGLSKEVESIGIRQANIRHILTMKEFQL